MKNYPVVFFDLDGTIADSGLGVTKSVAFALRHWGIEVADLSSLNCFIGPPLRDSFQNFYGQTAEQAEESVAQYRIYYRDTGIFECTIYDGLEELLIRLKQAGKRLGVATSKPEEFAVRILEHFGLAQYFDWIAGATLDGSRDTKPQVISYALEQAKIADPSQVIMVGDREYDILGAKAFGMDGIGVAFGYGSRQELEAAGAVAVAENTAELADLLLAEGTGQ